MTALPLICQMKLKSIKTIPVSGLLWLLILFFAVQPQIDAQAQTEFERIALESRIPGKNLSLLYLRPKFQGEKQPPILFIHGASFPSALAFGYRMNGISWMDNLADQGFHVFALDHLGYGRSDRYTSMLGSRQQGDPEGKGQQVVKDIEKAVSYILETTGSKRLNLIGHSWGATVSGYYASTHPDQIESVVLFAPIVERPDTLTWLKPNSAYLELTPQKRVSQFYAQVPPGQDTVLENDVIDFWEKRWLESDLEAEINQREFVRYPSGWKYDLYNCWSGDCFFDPQKLTVPTLLVRGEWDTSFNEEDASALFKELANVSTKRSVLLEKSTHVAHLEKSRYQLYNEVNLFLTHAIKTTEEMVAVIFEVEPKKQHKQAYLNIASELKSELEKIDGFISIERFGSLQNPDKILSLSYWRDEDAVKKWRNLASHRNAQARGRQTIFKDYRLRVAHVVRDYGMTEREEAPVDSREIHD